MLSHRASGFALREVQSGTGYVDVAVVISGTLHLVEVKILTSTIKGAAQLNSYMKRENRPTGWLLAFDTRSPSPKRQPIPKRILVPSGVVRVITIDACQVPPSRLRDHTAA